MHLYAGVKEPLEDVYAALGMGAYELAPHLRGDGVDRDVHGLEAAGNDALHVLVGHVGERDEVALEEGEAVVVVAKREGRTSVFRQHAHEAELAGVHAGANAVEEDVGEVDAPVLAWLAPELAGVGAPIRWVEDLKLAGGAVGLPAPVDQVPERVPVDALYAHARLDARLPSRAILLNRLHPGAKRTLARGGVVSPVPRHRCSPTVDSMAPTTALICDAGVDAPAVTPTSDAPSNQEGSSSSAPST